MERANMQSNNTAQRTSKNNTWFESDRTFDQLYPLDIQQLARRHWTPLVVARKASSFLATEKNKSILDIGSGAGKFCIAAAHYNPDAYYFGVEQRISMLHKAETARQILRMGNVTFIHSNFTRLDFRDYDHFYFYNSFYENLTGSDRIDNSIVYSAELYNYYNRYLYQQLDQKPEGTKLVTYHSMEDEIPNSYRAVGSEFDNLLKFWIKDI
jgi:SAM-dependent methyltransferase